MARSFATFPTNCLTPSAHFLNTGSAMKPNFGYAALSALSSLLDPQVSDAGVQSVAPPRNATTSPSLRHRHHGGKRDSSNFGKMHMLNECARERGPALVCYPDGNLPGNTSIPVPWQSAPVKVNPTLICSLFAGIDGVMKLRGYASWRLLTPVGVIWSFFLRACLSDARR